METKQNAESLAFTKCIALFVREAATSKDKRAKYGSCLSMAARSCHTPEHSAKLVARLRVVFAEMGVDVDAPFTCNTERG